MAQLREMLSEELQDLLHAETLLTKALPQMAQAAHNPRLKEAFEQHLTETETHVERLKKAFDLLGEKAQPKTCKAMVGLVEEGKEIMSEGSKKPEIAADLALITAAQKVEHYEISGYGTVRNLARQIGEIEISKLMSHTLGEEEGADFLLTDIAKPMLQEAALEELSTAHATHQKTKTAAR
jgi:Mn-containing catalase